MRILYICAGLSPYGGTKIIFEHMNRLIKKGHDVYYTTNQPEFDNDASWFDLKAKYVDIFNVKDEYDIAVATFWTTAHTLNDLDLKKAKKFYLIQGREVYFVKNEYLKLGVEETYSYPFTKIVIAKQLQDWLKENYNCDSYYIKNAIDTNVFKPIQPLIPKVDGKFRILIEGNGNVKYKGVDDAFQAIRGLKNIEVMRLSIEPDKKKRKVNYKFINPPQDKIPKIYCSCDCLLKCSYLEGSPLPHLEAMACGVPVVTTNCVGVNEFCIDFYNCLMAECGNINEIRDMLIKLMTNKELREDVIKYGLSTSKEFNWDVTIDKLIEIFEK